MLHRTDFGGFLVCCQIGRPYLNGVENKSVAISLMLGFKNAQIDWTREDKGDREGIPPTHPISQVIRLELFLRPQIPRGIRQQPIISANVFRVDDPRSELRVLHELTQNKMAEDAESDVAIRFVDEKTTERFLLKLCQRNGN